MVDVLEPFASLVRQRICLSLIECISHFVCPLAALGHAMNGELFRWTKRTLDTGRVEPSVSSCGYYWWNGPPRAPIE